MEWLFRTMPRFPSQCEHPSGPRPKNASRFLYGLPNPPATDFHKTLYFNKNKPRHLTRSWWERVTSIILPRFPSQCEHPSGPRPKNASRFLHGLPNPPADIFEQKETSSCDEVLVGAGGFGPPKSETTDLQSVYTTQRNLDCYRIFLFVSQQHKSQHF